MIKMCLFLIWTVHELIRIDYEHCSDEILVVHTGPTQGRFVYSPFVLHCRHIGQVQITTLVNSTKNYHFSIVKDSCSEFKNTSKGFVDIRADF